MAIGTRAAVLERKGSPLSVREIRTSPPGEREVLVKMDLAGLCRSDLNAITGHTRYNMPLVLGHEGTGTAVETGRGVRTVKEGDMVVLSWAAYCGVCFYCKRGLTHLCDTVAWPRGRGLMPDWTTRFNDRSGAIYHFNGVSSFSEYTVVHETGCVVVDRDVPVDVAAVIGCSVVTGVGAVFNTVDVPEGSSCMVVGGGNVGMSMIQALRIRGAAFIILVDPDSDKWDAAKRAGADYTAEEICTEEIRALTGGLGVDFSFDGVASGETIRRSLGAVRRGGTVVMVGSPHPASRIEISPIEFHLEKSIVGSLYGSSNPGRDIPMVIDLYRKGLLNLDGFINRGFGLGEINTAVDELARRGGKYTIAFD